MHVRAIRSALATAFIVGSSFAALPTAHAATVVNFDGLNAPNTFGATLALNHYANLTFAGTGGAANGGGVLNSGASFGVNGYSAPNFLAFNCNAHYNDGGIAKAPEKINLKGLKSGVSFTVGSNEPGAQVKATGKGSGPAEVHTLALTPTLQTVTFSSAVKTITIAPVGVTCIFVVDDLTYS
ncbi:MAG: hypothetical protein JWL83_4823 [Actinomycetia bacterium]|nr:hypothetical protein [Actinomycetes bacterium]